MLNLDADNAVEYLHQAGWLPRSTAAEAELLAWGVSNVVLRIRPEHGEDFVLKQSREQLRTKADWFSRLDRIYREILVMRHLRGLLPRGTVPSILFEDRDNYLFAMEAVSADHTVWKSDLLSGRFDPHVAATLGDSLSTIHRATHSDSSLKEAFADKEVFDQLRVDPFYRYIARAHPEIQPSIERLADEVLTASVCLVLGDFSPKNVLLSTGRLTLVDFETGHFGDPAFDLGFFLSHLLLKTILHVNHRRDVLQLARTFQQHYFAGITTLAEQPGFQPAELESRTIVHLAACMLARVDGKSPVDYLPREQQHDLVRSFCCRALLDPPASLERLFDRLDNSLTLPGCPT